MQTDCRFAIQLVAILRALRKSQRQMIVSRSDWTLDSNAPLTRKMAVRVTTGAAAWLELGGRWCAHGLLLQLSYEDTSL